MLETSESILQCTSVNLQVNCIQATADIVTLIAEKSRFCKENKMLPEEHYILASFHSPQKFTQNDEKQQLGFLYPNSGGEMEASHANAHSTRDERPCHLFYVVRKMLWSR